LAVRLYRDQQYYLFLYGRINCGLICSTVP